MRLSPQRLGSGLRVWNAGAELQWVAIKCFSRRSWASLHTTLPRTPPEGQGSLWSSGLSLSSSPFLLCSLPLSLPPEHDSLEAPCSIENQQMLESQGNLETLQIRALPL